MYAVDDLSDAIDVTREFLTPLRAGLWLKLLVVIFFLSGVGFSGPTIPFGDIGMVADDPGLDELEAEFGVTTEEILLGFAVLAGISILFWLLFRLVGSFMEFVLYESLRSGDVHFRRYLRRNAGRALHLFAFRLAGALVLGVFVGAPTVYAVLVGGVSTTTAATLAVIGLLALPLYLLYALVMRFTTVFVAPVMLVDDRGLVSAWKRFWPTLAGNWTEYVVYLVLIWVVWLAVGVALAFVGIFAFIVIAIPFGILAFVLLALGTPGIVLAGFVVLLGFLLFFLVMALLEVPVYSYLRYYALLVLGDTDRELDLIPERRAAVRADGGNGDGERPDRPDSSADGRDDWNDDGDDWDTSDWEDSDDWGTSNWDDSDRPPGDDDHDDYENDGRR
ncbi:DUF7544 domain-containing protein [Natrialbaceae archaeon A-gly3]